MVEANLLTSDYRTGKLSIVDFDRPETECGFGTLFVLGITLLVYPIIFLSGCIWIAYQGIENFSSSWDQIILEGIQKDDTRLGEYGEEKFEKHKKKFANIQQKAIELVRKMQGILPELSTENEQSFLDAFLATDLTNLRKDPESFFKLEGEHLFTLKRYQLKLRCLQNESEMWESQTDERLERFRLIARIATMKKEFQKLESKQWIHRAALWLIPGGLFYTIATAPNDRAYIEEILIGEYNQLVGDNPFLLPYVDKHHFQDAAESN